MKSVVRRPISFKYQKITKKRLVRNLHNWYKVDKTANGYKLEIMTSY